MALSDALRGEIAEILKSNDVVLFMKGTPAQPACGFSAAVSGLLDELLPAYRSVNVLERADLREGIKEYANWATIPQLFVKGELVGGADIVRGLAAKGELPKLLGVTVPEVVRPEITVSDAAAKELKSAMADAGAPAVRLEIDRRFQYGLDLGEVTPEDFSYAFAHGVTLAIDKQSARRAHGLSIDFVAKNGQSGFKITNPNEPPKLQPMSAKELAERLASAEPPLLIDVRPEPERALAKIAAAKPLDAELDRQIGALDKAKAVLVFQCHHGQRSAAAAQRYLQLGFKNVYNLEGGISAWSREVDRSVPEY